MVKEIRDILYDNRVEDLPDEDLKKLCLLFRLIVKESEKELEARGIIKGL